MNDLSVLYQEMILDHSRHPHNFGQAEGSNRQADGNNPLCGDRVTVFLRLEDGVIVDASFDARGCAISLASASMMTDLIKGKTEAEVHALFNRFHTMVAEPDAGDANGAGDDEMSELEALSGVRSFPSRIKCVTLAWHAMMAAFEGSGEEVHTE
jgi:nitrogen fixation NifU-like protein